MTWFLEGADRDATWVAGQFLEHVRRRISRQLNAQPSRTILTVPCVFRRPQRDALVEAFRAAGFAPLEKEVIEEPCAAAMWYLLREQKRTLDELRHRGDCHRLLVYDFGGGTLDLSLVEVLFSAKMPQTRIRVLASDGVRFGGDDLDRMLMKLLVARLRERRKGAYLENLTNTDLEVLLEPRLHLDDLRHLANRNRLRETAERMKRELSRSREAFPEDLFLEWPGGICPVPQRSEHDYLVVSRDDFYQELRPVLAEHNKVLVGSLCRSAGLSITELNLVLVTGGSSQVPLVKELLHGLLPPDLVDYPADLPAKTLVAEGALLWALHRKVLVGEAAKDLQLESLLNCQILIPTMPEMLLFERGVSLPGWKLFEWDRRQGLELRLIKREHRANGQIDTELGDILIPPQVAKEAARRTSDRLDILVRLTLDRTIEPYWIMDRKAAKGPRLPFRPTPGVSL
jgi:molecular chaperone DnaK (HSP70)